jgi:hypothetical protein
MARATDLLAAENEKMAARLAKLLASNQAAQERMGRESSRMYQTEQQRLEQQQLDADTNVQSGALKGASLGAIGGPWGSLVGGILGAGMGTVGAYKARRAAGKGKLSSFWDTFKDISNPVSIVGQLGSAISAPGGEQRVTAAMAPMANRMQSSMEKRQEERALASAAEEKANRDAWLNAALEGGEYKDPYTFSAPQTTQAEFPSFNESTDFLGRPRPRR